MAGKTPQVGIGMPVHNEERFVRQALDSLLSQSFEDFELIICDNASTDRTGDICAEYVTNDQRIGYYRSETNVGSIPNFNRAFELCSAEYFFWASGHDLRHETFISRCLEILERDTSTVLCYPKARWIDSNGEHDQVIPGHVDTRGLDQLSGFHTVLWGLSYGYPIYGIIRSSALRRTRLLRDTIAPDIVLLAELSLLGAFAQVPEALLYVRRLSDHRSWDRYLQKSLGPDVTMRSPLYLYCKWIRELMGAVARQVESWRGRSVPMLSAILCVLTKHRWIFRALRQRHRVSRKAKTEYAAHD